MDATTEAVPEAIADEIDTQKIEAGTEPPAAQPSKPTKPTKTNIPGYGEVMLEEVIACYDERCPHNCHAGELWVFIPGAKKGEKGRRLRELCPCTVEGYRRKHPLEEPLQVGALAEAAKTSDLSKPKANPRRDQVKRLASNREVLQAKLDAIEISDREASEGLVEQLQLSEGRLKVAGAARDAAEDDGNETAKRIAELQQHLAALDERRKAHESIAATESVVAAAIRRNIDRVCGGRTAEKAAITRAIERLDTRIARIIEYYPKAALD